MCERIEVSIIIPVYNEEKQISHCLDSIQCQEYKNYEVIIVDDGSIDKTGEICDSYAKKDSRFKVIHEANGGVSVARNKGIDVATGKLLMFVDSDDFVKPDFINNYVKMQSESDADVIIGGIALEEKGKSIKSETRIVYGITYVLIRKYMDTYLQRYIKQILLKRIVYDLIQKCIHRKI